MPEQRAEFRRMPGQTPPEPVRIPQLKIRSYGATQDSMLQERIPQLKIKSRSATQDSILQEHVTSRRVPLALMTLACAKNRTSVNIDAAMDYILDRPFQFTNVSKRRDKANAQLYAILSAKEKLSMQIDRATLGFGKSDEDFDSASIIAEDGSCYSFQIKPHHEELLTSVPEDPGLNLEQHEGVNNTQHPAFRSIRGNEYGLLTPNLSLRTSKGGAETPKPSPLSPQQLIDRVHKPLRLTKPASSPDLRGPGTSPAQHHYAARPNFKQTAPQPLDSANSSHQSISLQSSPSHLIQGHETRRKPTPPRSVASMLGNSWYDEMHRPARALSVVEEADPVTDVEDSQEADSALNTSVMDNNNIRRFGQRQSHGVLTSPAPAPTPPHSRSRQTFTSPVTPDSPLRPRQVYTSPVTTEPHSRSRQVYTPSVTTSPHLRSVQRFRSQITTDQSQPGHTSHSQITTNSRFGSAISHVNTTSPHISTYSATSNTPSRSYHPFPSPSTPPTITNSQSRRPNLTISPMASPYFCESPFEERRVSSILRTAAPHAFTGQSPININKKKEGQGALSESKRDSDLTSLGPMGPTTPLTPATQYFEEFPLSGA